MKILYLIGRVLVGGFYLYSGVDNLINFASKVGYVASKGVPMPQLLIPLSGVLMLIGGLSILTGFYPKVGIAAIVVFLLPVTFIMHNFWTIPDPMMRLIDMHNFQANIGLIGSALLLLAIPTPWPYSLAWPVMTGSKAPAQAASK